MWSVSVPVTMPVTVVLRAMTVVDTDGDILTFGEDIHLLPDQLERHGDDDCPDVTPDVQHNGTTTGMWILRGVGESFVAHGLVSSDVVVGDSVWNPPPGCAMNGKSSNSTWFLLDVPSIKALAASSGV